MRRFIIVIPYLLTLSQIYDVFSVFAATIEPTRRTMEIAHSVDWRITFGQHIELVLTGEEDNIHPHLYRYDHEVNYSLARKPGFPLPDGVGYLCDKAASANNNVFLQRETSETPTHQGHTVNLHHKGELRGGVLYPSTLMYQQMIPDDY